LNHFRAAPCRFNFFGWFVQFLWFFHPISLVLSACMAKQLELSLCQLTLVVWYRILFSSTHSLVHHPGQSEPAPSTGCPLLLSCGWTSTELISGFTLVTRSTRSRSSIQVDRKENKGLLSKWMVCTSVGRFFPFLWESLVSVLPKTWESQPGSFLHVYLDLW
jgi:hypothetical protein